jgi:hypothetical protein
MCSLAGQVRRCVRQESGAIGSPKVAHVIASGRELDKKGPYAIRVQAHLDESWSQWFDGWDIKHEGEDTTVLTGRVAGQPALHRLLAKIRDLGLPLVSLNCVKPNEGEVPEQLI